MASDTIGKLLTDAAHQVHQAEIAVGPYRLLYLRAAELEIKTALQHVRDMIKEERGK